MARRRLALLVLVATVASGCSLNELAPSGPVRAAGSGAREATVAPDDPSTTATGGDDSSPRDPADPATDPGPAIASAGGLDLYLPAAGAILVAFHEGSSAARDLAVEVPTRAVMNGGADATVTTDTGPTDVAAMVLPSRRRSAGATTAVDVVVPPSVPILAPVQGTVVSAEEYALYGRHTDVRIVIEPDGHPGSRVTLLHVTDPQVHVGDRVEAGVTTIAGGARRLPVASQVDRFTVHSWVEEAPPHVHLEVHARSR